MLISQIEINAAKTLKIETGATVEVVCRTAKNWTISGIDEDARKAATWLEEHSIMRLDEPPIHDDELGLTFCYMTVH